MKSALFVQANVAVNTKLTSKVPRFLKKIGQKRAIPVWYDGKIFLQPPSTPVANISFFRCPFQYPKVPLEAGAPPIF
jgi:hypothetical protein